MMDSKIIDFFRHSWNPLGVAPDNNHSGNCNPLAAAVLPDTLGLRKASGIVHGHIQKSAVAWKHLAITGGGHTGLRIGIEIFGGGNGRRVVYSPNWS